MSSPAAIPAALGWLAAADACPSAMRQERSQGPLDEAYRERARHSARAIIQQGNADPEQQEV